MIRAYRCVFGFVDLKEFLTEQCELSQGTMKTDFKVGTRHSDMAFYETPQLT